MKRRYKGMKGFTLIELLVVVTIIGVLAAIAIPSYLGLQERSRRSAVIRAASASESELQAWLHSSVKTGIAATLKEADTNGDGVLDTSDLINADLSAAGVCNRYVDVQNSKRNLTSPWNASLGLWNTSVENGRIACIMIGNSAISVQATDPRGVSIHTKLIVSD